MPGVLLQVWNQNGRVPYITYEYTILRHAISPVAPPPLYTGPDSSAGGLSVELGGLQGPNSSLYHQGPPLGQVNIRLQYIIHATLLC